ncbi:MAG TPA: tail fiber protein [Mesorhizobium sp.]|jgi:microcystin-dependent protein|uniref:phage tail protein n=1 Tax=Mesorhizobium sp. TaxID=1871066 RepID=UPI002DDD4429|nr:tail fiber protein [Mesorhizobium sp.]HEV2507902.1 tail fiber protein [Mesorhizobium sp.]
MADFFLGQIMMTGFAYPQKGFAFCNGAIVAIAQNQALFSLLGTVYGGNGVTTFALPNLQSRTPAGFGTSSDPNWQPSAYNLGQTGGVENVTLLSQNLPMHLHVGQGTTSNGAQRSAGGALYGTNTNAIYAAPNGRQVTLSPQTLNPVGGNQAHPNLQPYETINFNIAMTGIFPSRN